MRRAKTRTYLTFPRRWMILTGALMTFQFGSYRHPCELALEKLQSTFDRSNIISNHVNLSPIPLAMYNLGNLIDYSIISLKHLLILQRINLPIVIINKILHFLQLISCPLCRI